MPCKLGPDLYVLVYKSYIPQESSYMIIGSRQRLISQNICQIDLLGWIDFSFNDILYNFKCKRSFFGGPRRNAFSTPSFARFPSISFSAIFGIATNFCSVFKTEATDSNIRDVHKLKDFITVNRWV